MKIKHYLLDQTEEDLILTKISEYETPLWKYWDEFVTMSLENWKSKVFLSWVYSVFKNILKNTDLITIECFDNIEFLFDELVKLKTARNWSPVTYNSYRKCLNSYFLHLVRMKHINDNPIHRIQKAKEADKAQPITNMNDVENLLDFLDKWKTMENLRDNLYFNLAVLTGARPIELLNLTLNSFTDDRKDVRISWAKQNSKERIYEAESISDCLSNYIKSVSRLWRTLELNDYLFLSATARWKPFTSDWVNKLYQRLEKKLWFRINTYMIRRFAATNLYKDWLAWNELMDYLWHTRWATTKKYIQNSSDFTKKATGLMSKFLKKPNSTDVFQ